jgi:hypothetical protein
MPFYFYVGLFPKYEGRIITGAAFQQFEIAKKTRPKARVTHDSESEQVLNIFFWLMVFVFLSFLLSQNKTYILSR